MAAQTRRGRVHTILIVDDEPRILDSVRMNLELEGYQVFEATNGQEALDAVRLRLPDLVVMDHETLLRRVWGPEYRDASHYVRLYINYLRQKLEDDPANPSYIQTERGVGYRFADLSQT